MRWLTQGTRRWGLWYTALSVETVSVEEYFRLELFRGQWSYGAHFLHILWTLVPLRRTFFPCEPRHSSYGCALVNKQHNFSRTLLTGGFLCFLQVWTHGFLFYSLMYLLLPVILLLEVFHLRWHCPKTFSSLVSRLPHFLEEPGPVPLCSSPEWS